MENFLNELPANVKEIAEKNNLVKPEDVIITPNSRIQELCGCTENDVKLLKAAAAKIYAQSVSPVSALLQQPLAQKWSRLTFGCAELDRCTNGGLLSRGITEICGVSGAGKTQLLLQLSLTVQLPREIGGLGRAVAFICTEDAFPSKRLFEMSKSFAKRYAELNINYMGNVYIEHALESEDLLKCVQERLSKLMSTIGIGLIIIDSVAAIFRVYTNYIQRATDMRRLANALLYYADKYNCVVICVNQVATVSDAETEVPCLGLAWAHLGRTRIRISKVPKQIKWKSQLLTVRKFEIMYSPETPNDFAEFVINEDGVIDVPGK